MKDFMINLYSNDNFPIILFSIIGILLLLFIITLILALNDTKKKKENILNEDKMEKEEGLENPNNKIVIEENVQPTLNEEVNEKPIIEDFSFDDIDLPSVSKIENIPVKESIVVPDISTNVVKNSENIELPKTNEFANFNKVVDSSSVLNVKSLNDIPEEEYRIK